MRRRSNLLLYLILNIIVSAGTTLAVLAIWDEFRPPVLARPPEVDQTAAAAAALPAVPTAPLATATLPPKDQQVIIITSIIGAGDLNQEVVLLKRIGEGNLLMTGWTLKGESGNSFTFTSPPELILFKDGAIQVYSKAGDPTPTDVYWGRSEPAWRTGETVLLLDREGNLRAQYTIP